MKHDDRFQPDAASDRPDRGPVDPDLPRFGGDRGTLPAATPGSPEAIRRMADAEDQATDDAAANRTPSNPSMNSAMAAAIRAEHALRAATARTMGSVSLPQGLRARVLAAVAADRASTSAMPAVQYQEPHAAHTSDLGPVSISAHGDRDTRDASTWANAATPAKTKSGPDRFLPAWTGFAAAAAVLLVATLYFTSLFGQGGSLDPEFRVNFAQASFITQTHTKACDKTADVVADFQWTDETTVMTDIASFIGTTLCVGRLPGTQGCSLPVRFEGAGGCNLPGTEKAMHVLMRFSGSTDAAPSSASANPAHSTTASLFISKAPATEAGLDPDLTYRMDGAKYGCEGFDILMWQINGVRYHLATRTEARELADMILAGFGRPEPTAAF